MAKYSISEFVEATRQQDRGDIKFTREGILEHGVGKLLKKAVSGDGFVVIQPFEELAFQAQGPAR